MVKKEVYRYVQKIEVLESQVKKLNNRGSDEVEKLKKQL
jgi:hypothetical protein